MRKRWTPEGVRTYWYSPQAGRLHGFIPMPVRKSSEALKILSEPSQGKEFFPAHKSARDGSLSPRKHRPTVGHACTRRPSHLAHPRERPTRYQIAPTHGFARRLEAAHALQTITTLVRALDAVKSAGQGLDRRGGSFTAEQVLTWHKLSGRK